jgi:hypothetical protein
MAKKEKKVEKVQLSDWEKKILAKKELFSPENLEKRWKAKQAKFHK